MTDPETVGENAADAFGAEEATPPDHEESADRRDREDRTGPDRPTT